LSEFSNKLARKAAKTLISAERIHITALNTNDWYFAQKIPATGIASHIEQAQTSQAHHFKDFIKD